MILTLGLLTVASAHYGAAYAKKPQGGVSAATKPIIDAQKPAPIGKKYIDTKTDALAGYGAAYRGKAPSTSGSASAGSTSAGSTSAGSTSAGSTNAGSTNAGSTNAGSTASASGTGASASDPRPADAVVSSVDDAGNTSGTSADSIAVGYPGLSLTWVLIVTGAVFAFVLIGVFAYSRLKNRIIDEETAEDSQSHYSEHQIFSPATINAPDADVDDGSDLSLPH
jgi:hypothetical protein